MFRDSGNVETVQAPSSQKSRGQPRNPDVATEKVGGQQLGGQQLPADSESSRQPSEKRARERQGSQHSVQNSGGRHKRRAKGQRGSFVDIDEHENTTSAQDVHQRNYPETPNSTGAWLRVADERVREFPTQTSCHGISRAFSRDRNWTYKWLWTAVTFLSLSILLVCLYEIRMRYLEYPFEVRTMTTVEPHLPFPAVTICSLSELDTRKAANLPRVSNASAKLLNLYATESIVPHTPLSHCLKDPDYRDLLELSTKQVYSAASPTVQDLLMYCSYNRRPFTCASRFSKSVLAPHCFQFNANRSNALREYSLGPKSGLAVIIRGDSRGYLVGETMAAGAKVTLHQSGTFADIAMEGSLLKPGSTTFMKIQVTEEKRLPYPYKSYGSSYCEDRDPSYTHQSCIYQCIRDTTTSKCKCSAFANSKGDKDYHDCKFRKYMACFRPTFDDYSSHVNEGSAHCQQQCPRSCHQYTYTTQESYAEFPSAASSAFLAGDPWNWLDSSQKYMELRIFFEQMKKTKITYTPYYTTEVLLASLGGHMGFFLGASFITLFEMVEVTCYAITWLYAFMRDDRQHNSSMLDPVPSGKKLDLSVTKSFESSINRRE